MTTNIQRLLEKIHGKPLEETLRQMYLVEEMPVYKIAEQLGVAPASVHRWLKQYNFSYHKPNWQKGLSKQEIEKVINLNKNT